MSQAASRTAESSGNDVPLPDSRPGGISNSVSRRPLDLNVAYAPIESELREVEAILRTGFRSETPFVDQLLEHSWLLGGKRIRPVFLLLSGASCGSLTPAHLQLAAGLEMIHSATLIHDDVLDEAATRRHQATTNATWGNKVSVLLGDYLFTNAFYVASLAGSPVALQMLAQASNRVCEGEMRQNQWQGDFELSEANYLQMITEKTAELCGVACKLGAYLSLDSASQQSSNGGQASELSTAEHVLIDQFEGYGRSLGVAFQIIDDVLDVVGQQEEVGKTLGTDLANQKPTLPVIHCLEHCDEPTRTELKRLLVSPGSTTEALLPFLERTDSLNYARSVAQQHARAATEFAKSLDASVYSTALENLAEFVLQRTF